MIFGKRLAFPPLQVSYLENENSDESHLRAAVYDDCPVEHNLQGLIRGKYPER